MGRLKVESTKLSVLIDGQEFCGPLANLINYAINKSIDSETLNICGDTGQAVEASGLPSSEFSFDGYHSDDDSFNALFFDNVGNGLSFALIRDSTVVPSATNPVFEGEIFIGGYQIAGGDVGGLESLGGPTWPINGTLTRRTSGVWPPV